jgi:predicted phage baseplate assembly protein
MALIAPVLDNRTYEQLRDELIGRIPSVTPEWKWTNHNESDPGIALLELFAHLGESLLYRFNQIPETTQVAFLQLLGVRPRPAQPAQALLAARTDRATGVQALKNTEAVAGSVLFETDDEVFIWPLDILAAGKTPDAPHALTKQERESRTDALARAGVAANDAAFYRTTLVPADPLAPDATSLDVSRQVDQALWIALLAKPTTDVTALAGQTMFLGVAFDEAIDPPLVLDDLDAAGATTYGSANLTRDPPPMTWQIWNGPDPAGRPFTRLAVIGDTSRGLLTSGVVKVVLPPRLPVITGSADGGEDAPPPLDDAALAARVLAWIRVSRPPTSQLGDAIGRVRWAGINAVGATQARTATAELLGSGTGDAGQQFPLSHRPVLPGTVVLEVEEAAGWVRWTEVDNFALDSFAAARAAGGQATERPYTVDPDTGIVSFGQAKVPQIGERIRVLTYRYGGGAAGNVGTGAISGLTGIGGVEVGNPLPAVGGSDAADVTRSLDAIPGIVHRHDRAVIAGDFEALAAEVAGVARADTLARMHPDNPRDEAAGVVSVVVFGPGDAATAHAPLPDLGLLRRVARYLDARRLVTTELYVIPPEYVEIHLAVGLQVREGYQADAVRRWVDQILRRYLAPLPTGGPDGKGWPLGRNVRRAELEAVAVQVEGVEYLENLRLGRVRSGGVDEEDLVELEKWQVPAVVGLTVSVGPALEPGVGEEPTPPARTPVPLPVEVC